MCTFCWSQVPEMEDVLNPDQLFNRCAECGSEQTAMMILEKSAIQEKGEAKYALYCYRCGWQKFSRKIKGTPFRGWLCLCPS